MARKKQTRGTCHFCGREMARGGLARHLRSCEARQMAIDEADDEKRGRSQPIYHLQVQDAWGGDYWLHMEIQGRATLEDLDAYLRAIWLECCGHLSAFHIGGHRYTQIFDDGWSIGDEKEMGVQVQSLLSSGMEIPYEYDFGTTSEVVIKVVDERRGKPLIDRPLFLMARNAAPDVPCDHCDKPATHLCNECMYEIGEGYLICKSHLRQHARHDDYGPPTELVNSPRAGVCGYDGPAEPPY